MSAFSGRLCSQSWLYILEEVVGFLMMLLLAQVCEYFCEMLLAVIRDDGDTG